MSLKGQVAVITGGGQGIGKAIARILSEEGAETAITDINIEVARKTAEEFSTPDRRCIALQSNVADSGQVRETVDRILKEFGRIDVLVNNAGITRDGLLVRMKEDDWNQVIDINLNGAFYYTKAVLLGMTKQRFGRIVNIASIVGVMGNAGQSNYAASKAAVIGLTKSIAREYASRGVTANAVAPGFIDTGMTQKLSGSAREGLSQQIPLGRLGTPEDVAHAVHFLVSDKAGYITGQVIHVNGGMLMP